MEGSGEIRAHTSRNSHDPLDRSLADLALRQHDVVSGHRLAALGLSASAVSRHITRGRLHRVHRGVFCVGHALLTQRGRFMATVLACGPQAWASHYCSGVLYELGLGARRRIDVTTLSARGRTLPGIRTHRVSTLTEDDVDEIDGRDAHTVRKAFASDRVRDQRLMLLDWRVVRLPWQQVIFEPADVAATLRGLLR